MKITATNLPEVKLIEPDIFPDQRGYFFESYNQQKLAELGISETFIQDNVSNSKAGVLRGLHFQRDPYAQAKLVSVLAGEVFDVAADVRPGSATFGKWIGVKLSSENHAMLYVPKGFAHGFYVLSPEATFVYKCAGYYNKEASSGVIWNDPTLNVAWPIQGQPVLSEQDSKLPPLSSTV